MTKNQNKVEDKVMTFKKEIYKIKNWINERLIITIICD